MISGSIARRYARALLDIGVQNGHYEVLGKELERVSATIEGSAELRNTLENPIFPLSQRRGVLDEILKRIGVSPILRNFLMLLLDRGRIGSLPAVAREHRAFVDEHAGRIRATVTSPRPIAATLETRIRAALQLRTGKSVILEKHEDPSLLGGVVVQIGDLVYDGSVRTQLAVVRQQLLSQ